MNKNRIGKILPHLIAIFIFLAVAVIYCRPVFGGKVLFQEDVLQWQGMAQSSYQYKASHGHFPLWTNSMFGGMPAYLIAMDPRAPGVTGVIFNFLTLYLPKPASFFFLACICFYFLSRVLRTNPYIGLIGSLAFAYSTYNPVIIAAGHDTKMQCIALLPAFIGSLLLIYEKKYWLGAALTALVTGMLVSFNHMQIMYYCLIVALIMTIGYAVRWIRRKEFRHLALSASIALGAALTGVLSNSVTLFTTYDSSSETTRGGSELAGSPGQAGNYTGNGFGNNLAFAFSMYKSEPIVMWVPDMFGGSTVPTIPEKNSRAGAALRQMPADLAGRLQTGLSQYWGGIGDNVGGPPYVGAIICFLALLGLFVLDNKHKWWILAAFLLSIAMSWGGYFAAFNGLLLKWLPMYNKFRAPSMIIIIPIFLLCVLAVLTLEKIMSGDARAVLWKKYKLGLWLTTGLFLALIGFFLYSDYAAEGDGAMMQMAGTAGGRAIEYTKAFIGGLKADRQVVFFDSLLRSFLFTAVAALLIGFRVRSKIRPTHFLAVIGVLAFIDVMGVDLKYLNSDNYQERATYTQNFSPSPGDRQILRDTGYYRVFDLRDSALNTLSYGAMTAYFHRSIGGYHAAKLRIYEDLIDHQLYNFPDCRPVINMLNTKYIIWPTPDGGDSVETNRTALGPAWFVNSIRYESSPGAVMNALTPLHPEDTAILFEADRNLVQASRKLIRDDPGLSVPDRNLVQVDLRMGPVDARRDTSARLRLVKNDNDEISYLSESQSPRFAVFSEIFYNRGWRAWVDDRETPIFRTDYVLRGMTVPAGHHVIRFAFHPQAYYIGRQMQWMANIVLSLMMLAALLVTMQEARHRRRFLSA